MLLLAAHGARGNVLYVALSSTNAVSPFTNWTTAATSIQSAVDAANPGDQIVVSNGVYNTGSRIAGDGATNRLLVSKAVSVQSVNGSAVTRIDGGHAIRCVSLADGAIFNGFTITNGSSTNGGGVWCASTNVLLMNCLLINNTAASGGGAYSGTLSNCNFTGNTCPASGGSGAGAAASVLNYCSLNGNSTGTQYPSASGSTIGGGAAGCILINCTLSGNSAYGIGAGGGGAANSTLIHCTIASSYAIQYGGGAYNCLLTNCQLTSNSAGSGGAGATGGAADSCVFSGNICSGGYGGGAYNGSVLTNCTFFGNQALWGAGAYNCTLNNCIVTNNSASGGYGGGVAFGTMNNSLLAFNTAYQGGGGYEGNFNNCTVTGNTGTYDDGGIYGGVLRNSVIYYNSGKTYPNGRSTVAYGDSINFCCTTPLPTTGTANLTNAPLFVNQAAGDFHLQTNSTCINSGNNAYVIAAIDLDGNPRIKGGTVDFGAYEMQFPRSVLPYQWALQYGLATDGSADFADPDHDGMNNWQEWIAGTNPTNALSVLKMQPLVHNASGWLVTWQSVSNRTYYLQFSTNLGAPVPFSAVRSNLAGLNGTTSFTDTNVYPTGSALYRVGVQ
jgi:hypothetical protein